MSVPSIQIVWFTGWVVNKGAGLTMILAAVDVVEHPVEVAGLIVTIQ